jgi:hypothetical protein
VTTLLNEIYPGLRLGPATVRRSHIFFLSNQI